MPAAKPIAIRFSATDLIFEVSRIVVQKVGGRSRSRRSPMIGFGYFKGMYDANIRASLHDVAPPERRATAVGVMNALGWPARRRARRG
jgi:hypothetical protein